MAYVKYIVGFLFVMVLLELSASICTMGLPWYAWERIVRAGLLVGALRFYAAVLWKRI